MIQALTTELILADIDVNPTAPPGSEGLTTIVGWIAWSVAASCLVAFIVCAGWLAFSALSGREIQAAKGLIIAIIAAVLVGSASAIFAVFGA